MSDCAAEMNILRATLRQHLDKAQTDEPIAPLLSVVNWHHLLWLGRQHGVLLFLYDLLKVQPLVSYCPPAIIAQLQGFHEMTHLRSLAHAREACQLQDLFDRHAIEAISTDRWMAAYCAHGHNGLIEPGTNFHYLAPIKDEARVKVILVEAGHPVQADVQKLVKAGQTPVLINRNLGKHPSANRLWTKPAWVTLGGRKLRRLTPGHWLLQRASEHLVSPSNRLIQSWEIVSLARSLCQEEWDALMSEAAHFGLKAAVIETVTASYQALDLPLPATMPEEFKHDKKRSAHVKTNDAPLPLVKAPFLPTPASVAAHMLKLAETGSADRVYDLGCGDGRILVKAAKDCGAHGIGVDLDPLRIAEARACAAKDGVSDRVTFVCGDIFATDLSEATVLCLYLLPVFYPRLREKLQREARPGLRIVSHDYIFPGWPPEKTEIIRSGPLKVSQLYLWRIG